MKKNNDVVSRYRSASGQESNIGDIKISSDNVLIKSRPFYPLQIGVRGSHFNTADGDTTVADY